MGVMRTVASALPPTLRQWIPSLVAATSIRCTQITTHLGAVMSGTAPQPVLAASPLPAMVKKATAWKAWPLPRLLIPSAQLVRTNAWFSWHHRSYLA